MFGSILNPWKPAAIALAVALLAALVYGGTMHFKANLYESQRDVARNELNIFVSQTRHLGERAKAEAAATTLRWAKLLADARNAAAVAGRDLDNWLRNARAGSRGAPDAPGTPAGTDRKGQICLDRAELDGALRQRGETVSRLIAEGSQAVIDRAECIAAWPTN